jgi:peptidoglycan/xylan/chitin deacetylase (PgdA/CDA1 family)
MWKKITAVLFGWMISTAPIATNVTPPVAMPAPVPAQASATVTPPSPGQKIIYLTFDADMTPAMLKRLRDGKVSAWYDPAIPDYLDAQKVPATVFTTGMFAELYPDLIKRLARSGTYSIENHSYDHAGFEPHCYGLATLTTDVQKRLELTKTQKIIHALTGSVPTLFRYPGLCRNDHDDAIVKSEGLTVNDGDIVSGDAFSTNAAAVARQVEKLARPGGIVVMHLGGPNAPATGKALTIFIPKLREEGYTFARL